MAWTAPSTWTAGATVTAAQLNQQLRDNLKAIGDPWTSYTPTLTGMSIGNGAMTAKYISAGKLITLSLYISAGGTTSYSGNITISLPVTAISGREQVGTLKLFNGSNDTCGVATIATGASTMIPRVPTSNTNGNLLQMSNTSPNPSTTGNMVIQITYEAA